MVKIQSSEEWQRQSSLLLAARPTTTRITTKYTLPNLTSPKYQRRLRKQALRASKTDTPAAAAAAPADAAKTPRAYLTLKTFDPESGVCLKFRTDQGALVGRLVAGLGALGRGMGGLAEKAGGADVVMEDGGAVESTAVAGGEAGGVPVPAAVPGKGQQGAGGGKKKGKKGKK